VASDSRSDRDHEPADADDRVVELHPPDAAEPPIDDKDRDPAIQERRAQEGVRAPPDVDE
jgi:hypothetical protein